MHLQFETAQTAETETVLTHENRRPRHTPI